MRPSDEALQRKYLSDLAWEKCREEVIERDGGLCLCGEPAGQVHHILGRDRPDGFFGLPPVLQREWPHVEPNGIAMCLGGHEMDKRYPAHMPKRLLAYLLVRHGPRIWKGKSYTWWLSQPPFSDTLFGRFKTR